MSQCEGLNCPFLKSFFAARSRMWCHSATGPTLTADDQHCWGQSPLSTWGKRGFSWQHNLVSCSKKHPTNPSLSPWHPPLALAPNNYSSRAVPSTLQCSTITDDADFVPSANTDNKTAIPLFFLLHEVFRLMDFVSYTPAKQWNELSFLAQQKIERLTQLNPSCRNPLKPETLGQKNPPLQCVNSIMNSWPGILVRECFVTFLELSVSLLPIWLSLQVCNISMLHNDVVFLGPFKDFHGKSAHKKYQFSLLPTSHICLCHVVRSSSLTVLFF